MAGPDVTKDGHRVNMYFPAELYTDMKSWVSLHQTNITELCREAIRHYLQRKRKEMKQNELVETCRMLSVDHMQNINQWTGLDEEVGDDESIGLQKRRYRSGEG
jgi:metal-responsive CopG/Arc/MetJ family transcriptional regulator